MLKDLLKEVVAIVAGKQAEEIADLLDSKKHVNEFLIAKKLGITINQTRNILYKISDHGLVSSIRKKDKRKGWYTYFWKIEIVKSLEFLRDILRKRMDQLERQIKSRETKEFYICETCNIEFNEENALLHDFTCNECGKVFAKKDNTKLLREFKKNLDRLKKESALVNEELEKEKEKEEKKKFKGIKKEQEEKMKKRAKATAKRKRARKLAKKKPVQKKITKRKPARRKKAAKRKMIKRKPIRKKPAKRKLMKKRLKKISKKTLKKKPHKKAKKKRQIKLIKRKKR